jgi:hypothetical protein
VLGVAFFLGQIPHVGPINVFLLANFHKTQLEKCDFDQYKGFFMGKMVQIRQILKKKEIQIIRFLQ